MKRFLINKLIGLSYRTSKSGNRVRPKRTIGKVALFYRICDAGYPKVKPDYITKENCLRNAVSTFPLDKVEWHVLGDNICDATYDMILKYVPEAQVTRVSVGHGAGTFRMVYEEALKYSDDTLVYFLEDDYLHLPNSLENLKLAAEENFADYMALYDHPDKYGFENVNPLINGGGEKSRVFLTPSHHWKVTSSTTMTMASFVDVLKRDKDIWWRWTGTKHPYDFQIFIDLKLTRKAALICPIPSLSTHGETAFLAPLVDWEKLI